jgi:hypothetical protein
MSYLIVEIKYNYYTLHYNVESGDIDRRSIERYAL